MTLVTGQFNRLQPLPGMSDRCRQLFFELVESHPADYFDQAGGVLLQDYVETVAALEYFHRVQGRGDRYITDDAGVMYCHPVVWSIDSLRWRLISLSDQLILNPLAREKARQKE